jgi:hypothetical protein
MEYINPELVAGVGIISPPRSYPHQQPRDRCVGTAMDGDTPVLTPQGGATVKVTYADGTVEYKSAAGFSNKRGPRVSRAAQQPREHHVPDVLRYVNIVGNIGNVE